MRGEVTTAGEGVREFAVGDHVVSTFLPDWLDGEPHAEGFARTPGTGIDGYACEQVTAPEIWFTRAWRVEPRRGHAGLTGGQGRADGA